MYSRKEKLDQRNDAITITAKKTSSPISDSKDQPSLPCKKPPKHTLLVCSKIPTCVPSTPSVSLSCPNISNWLVVVSEVNALKYFYILSLIVKNKPTKFKLQNV